jgi:hypothetical protein
MLGSDLKRILGRTLACWPRVASGQDPEGSLKDKTGRSWLSSGLMDNLP